MHKRAIRSSGFALVLVIGLATGCVSGVDQPTSKLATLQVPADFTFAATAQVQVAASVQASAVPVGGGLLSVRRADGVVVFEGPLNSGEPFAARLVVPTSESRLTFVLHAAGREERSASADIVNGAVAVAF